MSTKANSYRPWLWVAVAGGSTAVIAAILLAGEGIFDWDIDGEMLFSAIPIGVVLALVGCVGWAWNSGRRGRFALASGLIFVAVGAIGIGYLSDGMNVHGSGGPVMLISFPTAALGVVVWIMGLLSKRV